TDVGHVLVYGITEAFMSQFDLTDVALPYADVFRAAADSGGFAVAAHAGRPRIGLAEHVEERGVSLDGVEAIEQLNGGSSDEENARALGLAEAQAQLGAEVAIASATVDGQPLYERMRVSDRMRLLSWTPRWELRLPGLMLRGLPAEAVRELKSFEADVVHVHGEFNADNIWAARIFNTPMILSPQGAFHPVALRKGRRIGKRLYINLARRLLYRRLKSFHAVSPAEAAHINALLGNVWVYCAPNGPSTSAHPSNGPEPSIGRKGDSPIRFLFVGRLEPLKGLDILFRAVASLDNSNSVRLNVVGGDENSLEKARLQALAARMKLNTSIRFIGQVTQEELPVHYNAADVCVMPSHYESFGLAALEAAACGRPVVASNVGGLPTIVLDGTTGYLVPSGRSDLMAERLCRLLSDDVLRSQLGAAARIHAETLGWDRSADSLLAQYRELVPVQLSSAIQAAGG
ncbi:MAG: glycosyltransferase family 4 protein, partial [Chloroflexi bacterium]|nr:glycosyltransferase family 4 protein [Chloroflexota bacterium]